MATQGKQWEVVRNPNKKSSKLTSQNMSKTQKKILKENMPTLETALPVKESSTIYDAFWEKEKTSAVGKENGHVKAGDDARAAAKKHSSQKKKHQGGGDQKKHQPQDLAAAIPLIDAEELENVLARDQATFPDNPSVWLKDLASILNLKMDKVPEPDPLFQGKPSDYPLCMLPKSVQQLLLNMINQCSTKTLELFLEHCVNSMVADNSKGISSYGHRMFIQILLHNKPDILTKSMHKYQDLMHANQNRPLRCLSIMWAMGQAGAKNLALGFRVWYDVMFPVLNVRNLANYVVEYVEMLFQNHKDLKSGYNVVSAKEYVSIMDTTFKPQSSVSGSLQKRLQAVYPKFKTMSFTQPESRLRAFFPLLLSRCTQGCNAALKAELVENLVGTLATDNQCFSVWRQLYTKTMQQSGVLLCHLNDNWEAVSKRLDTNLLRETVKTFDVTNEEVPKESPGSQGQQACGTACKDLLSKMAKTHFPWRWLLFAIVALFGSIIAYDVYVSKGFKNSSTKKFLADTGILLFLEQVWQRITVYSAKGLAWLQVNVPYYYGKVCQVVGPYLKLFWEKLYDLGLWIAEVTKPARLWLHEKIPQLLEWIHAKIPWLWSNVSHYLGLFWALILRSSLWLWQHVIYYTDIATTWLLANVFTGSLSPENILNTLSWVLVTLQGYTTAAVHWLTQLLTGTASESSSPPSQSATAG